MHELGLKREPESILPDKLQKRSMLAGVPPVALILWTTGLRTIHSLLTANSKNAFRLAELPHVDWPPLVKHDVSLLGRVRLELLHQEAVIPLSVPGGGLTACSPRNAAAVRSMVTPSVVGATGTGAGWAGASGAVSSSCQRPAASRALATVFPAAPQLIAFAISEVRLEAAFSRRAEVPAIEAEGHKTWALL